MDGRLGISFKARLHNYEQRSKDELVPILESEMELMFGSVGKFIVKKQLSELGGVENIEPEELHKLIDKLSSSVENVVGQDTSKTLKKRLRQKCGLPV